MTRVLHELGAFALFVRLVWRTWRTTRDNRAAIAEQMARVCLQALPTIAFAGLFTGAILVIQFHLMLKAYDAESMLGGLNTSAVVREVGPLIISFLLAGKIGAYTAAELGTMRVTEQIDAVECLGANPIQYLIVPRFVAIVLSSVLLLALGLVISIGGSMVIAQLAAGVNYLQFAASVPRFSGWGTLLGGIVKCAVYGVIVAGVSCHKGYTATGGARGVGRAVNEAAVYINFFVILGDFVTSQLLGLAGNLLALAREALPW
jgi:phospholipid/cholesterol/gamma-HCH transport system permease protein